MTTPLYFDVKGASELLGPGFGRSAIKRAIRDGVLPFRKVGVRVSIAHGDLIALADASRAAPIGPLDRARGENGVFVKKPARRLLVTNRRPVTGRKARAA